MPTLSVMFAEFMAFFKPVGRSTGKTGGENSFFSEVVQQNKDVKIDGSYNE